MVIAKVPTPPKRKPSARMERRADTATFGRWTGIVHPRTRCAGIASAAGTGSRMSGTGHRWNLQDAAVVAAPLFWRHRLTKHFEIRVLRASLGRDATGCRARLELVLAIGHLGTDS